MRTVADASTADQALMHDALRHSVFMHMSLHHFLHVFRAQHQYPYARTISLRLGRVSKDCIHKTNVWFDDRRRDASRGLDDEEIRKLWTPLSLVVARVALFMAWSGIALSLICGLSLGLLDQTEIAVACEEKSS